MTSQRRIAANRKNAKKSTGPRTRRGKARASRNAIRHGLNAADFGNSARCDKVDRIARMLCQHDPDASRYEQAIIIGESQLLLARVRAARIAAIERIRKGAVQCARPSPGYPSSDEIDDLFRDLKHGDFRNLKSVMNRFTSMLNALTNNQRPVPKPRKPSQPASDTCATSPKPTGDSNVLDEVACLCQAIPELQKLERYERRALSRRRRAIRKFDAMLH